MLFICVQTAWSQEKLTFTQYDDLQYAMKVDVKHNALKRTLDSELPPWLPKNYFGWQVKDNNHLGLFFQASPTSELREFNSFDQLAIAFVRYDKTAWDFQVESVIFNSSKNTLSIIYKESPLDGNLAFSQTSCKLVIIDQGRGIEKVGIRNVKFEVLRRSNTNPNQLIPLEDSLLPFPRTHTAEQYVYQSGRSQPLIDIIQDGSYSTGLANTQIRQQPESIPAKPSPSARGSENAAFKQANEQLESFRQKEKDLQTRKEELKKVLEEAEDQTTKMKVLLETIDMELDENQGKIKDAKSELEEYQSSQNDILARKAKAQKELEKAERAMDSALIAESKAVQKELEIQKQKQSAESKLHQMRNGNALSPSELAAKKKLEKEEEDKQELLKQKMTQYMENYAEKRTQILDENPITPSNFDTRNIGTTSGVAETRKDISPSRLGSTNTADLEMKGIEEGMSLKHIEIGGYKLRDRHNFEEDTYRILRSKIEFEMYLEKLPGQGALPILNTDFNRYYVLLIVKGGKKKFDFRTQRVRYYENKQNLNLAYSSKVSLDNLKEEVFTPYIVYIEKKETSRISLIENGKKIYDIPTR